MDDTKPLDELKKAAWNPRKISEHDFNALVKSMDEFGDLSGVIKNIETGELVGGHQRLEAFKKLGASTIHITWQATDPDPLGTTAYGYIETPNGQRFGYREVLWPIEKEKAANVAANRIQGEFDLDKLAELNYELSQLDNGQELLELTGQTPQEISNLLDSVGVSSDPAEDEAPPIDDAQPAVSKLGEIYQLGKHRLMCGDATDFGAVTDLVNGSKIDLYFSDPPYGVDVVVDGKVGADFGVAKKGSYEAVIGDSTTEAAQQSWEIIKELEIKKSIIWGGNYFTEFLPASASWIVWDKRGDSGIKNTFADCELAWSNIGSPARVYTQLWNGMIREGEHDARVHPTQKPVKMLSEVIRDYTERGNTILDLFSGSGSILIAADKLERQCFIMELSPAYCDVIRKRYHKHVAGQEEGWAEATPVINIDLQAG